MNLQWIEDIRRVFGTLYGEQRGLAVCNTVIPGIIGDFRKTVLASGEQIPVREEYRTEDSRAVLLLTGYRRGSVCVVTQITVNGLPVSLGGNELTL